MTGGRSAVGAFVDGLYYGAYFVFLLYILLPVVVVAVGVYQVIEKRNPEWAKTAEPYLEAMLKPFLNIEHPRVIE